jgi:hypothetical protein
MAVFWDVAPCSLVEVYRSFRGACCFHHQQWVSTRLHGATSQTTVIFLRNYCSHRWGHKLTVEGSRPSKTWGQIRPLLSTREPSGYKLQRFAETSHQFIKMRLT